MGKVYIVGAGPGDPELITLKALKVLREADVILYDRLIGKEVLSYAKETALLFYVGKEDGKHTIPQEEINRMLLKFSRAYQTVVRLKGGDPFVFGRGSEEVLFLSKHGVEWEVIPGVSSVYSVPASAGIPVTHRGISSSFAVITGHEAVGKEKGIDWSSFGGIQTLIILMGVKNRQRIARDLIGSGRDPSEPVAFIEKGTTAEQRTILSTLGEVAASPPPVEPPAVMVVGKVVEVGKEIMGYLKEVVPIEGTGS
jgi:uroporphyrin-III C-methyltransferase